MQKTIVLMMLAVTLLWSPTSASAMDRAQQEKDLEVKKRIYGVKYPWEILEPYPNVRGGAKLEIKMTPPNKSNPIRHIDPNPLKMIFPFDVPVSPDSAGPFA